MTSKKKRQIQSALQSQIRSDRQKLNDLRTVLNQVKPDRGVQKLTGQDHHIQQPLPKPSNEAVPQRPAPEGYILRFASDSALQTLISRGKVNFFAMTDKQTWQLGLSTGRPVFTPAPNPRQLYESETVTVPVEYVAAFNRQLTAVGPHTVTWGVTLPARTKASIHRLVRGQKGGDLLIMADGEVVLN